MGRGEVWEEDGRHPPAIPNQTRLPTESTTVKWTSFTICQLFNQWGMSHWRLQIFLEHSLLVCSCLPCEALPSLGRWGQLPRSILNKYWYHHHHHPQGQLWYIYYSAIQGAPLGWSKLPASALHVQRWLEGTVQDAHTSAASAKPTLAEAGTALLLCQPSLAGTEWFWVAQGRTGGLLGAGVGGPGAGTDSRSLLEWLAAPTSG